MIVETEAATLERKGDGSLDIRFRGDVKITIAQLEEVLETRIRMCGTGSYAVLVTLPEDLDFHPNVLMQDHYEQTSAHACTYAVAWDAETAMNEKVVEIFYRYFPQPFPVKIFRREEDALAWLKELRAADKKAP